MGVVVDTGVFVLGNAVDVPWKADCRKLTDYRVSRPLDCCNSVEL